MCFLEMASKAIDMPALLSNASAKHVSRLPDHALDVSPATQTTIER